MKRVLYVTWEGAAQNYMKSLFLPMLAHVQSDALSLGALWFTQSGPDVIQSTQQEAQRLGVELFPHPVKRGIPVLFQIAGVLEGARVLRRHVLEHGYDAVFVRAQMPSAMAWAMQVSWPKGCQLYFDSDGFPSDERVDAGLWTHQDPRYRAFRAVERHTVRRACATMVRTHKAKAILLERGGDDVDASSVHVIPNAKDPDAFHPTTPEQRQATRRREGVEGQDPWMVFVGSLGPQYYPAQILELFELAWARDPRARLHVLTGQAEVMQTLLAPQTHPAHARVVVKRVGSHEVAAYLAAADVGISLRAATFSQQGVCPIKNAEYLLCGTPVITGAGIGDMDALFDAHDVGYVLQDIDTPALEGAVEWMLSMDQQAREGYRARCRQAGLEHFSLDVQTFKLRDLLLVG